ncbi:pyrimidine dimer DNA glycosylase/endonuclease V [Georgenia sp. EYE_87]|uniref:pyrimidine dimer DNA glycosylase/endonuclease V n=1 Tax=Georgenia sp. EYE_87 TaxID=2853448 RepID=UPI0020050E69|nr:pyrimidine dimer DNA glycosylase/endonuclease V [Georgenia sp. EYE_87]MCK6211165.1 pyrimidine dimer DNA glycosylase/endonuclease V [Georgenia sp. EYE_87]
MRIWSLHPRYLDRQGLTACWREALLAQAVLAGRTRGYRQHSQLTRFRAQPDAVAAVGVYLGGVASEAARRGYRFDVGRIDRPEPRDGTSTVAATSSEGASSVGVSSVGVSSVGEASSGALVPRIPVTAGQVAHEWAHLSAKLTVRSPERAAAQVAVTAPEVHPLFVVVPGPVEDWERP